MYLDANPDKPPFLVQAQAITDAGARRNAIIQGERRAALGGAPTWMYIWAWATPAFDGKFGAVHGHDVDASFHIVRSNMVGSGRADGQLMADRLAAAWVAFAKTGDPNNPALPHWPPYEPARAPTMIFDTDTRVGERPAAGVQGAVGVSAALTADPSSGSAPPRRRQRGQAGLACSAGRFRGR